MNRNVKHGVKLWMFVFLCRAALLNGITAKATLGESNPSTSIYDDSDWWSIIRNDYGDFNLKSQNLDTNASNFQIDGIAVGNDDLPKIMARLGKATTVVRGDAAVGRTQICYVSVAEPQKFHLIFESGEVEYAFYLFADGPHWTGDNLCVKSRAVTADVGTASGLRLGLTPSQVESILGKPTARQNDRLIYSRSIRKRNSPRELKRLRQYHSGISEKEFHEEYDFYDLNVYIEARFSRSKLIYLGLSMSETN
jgi:hypothetical protein